MVGTVWLGGEWQARQSPPRYGVFGVGGTAGKSWRIRVRPGLDGGAGWATSGEVGHVTERRGQAWQAWDINERYWTNG